MNITTFPNDILHTIFKLLTPNIINVISTCKLFNNLILQNVTHIYEKDTFEGRKCRSLSRTIQKIYCFFANQQYEENTTITLEKSQHKIYEQYLNCKIISNYYNEAGMCFIKNDYKTIGFDYIQYIPYKGYTRIIPILNGYSSICFQYSSDDNNLVKPIMCLSIFNNNDINTLDCHKFIIEFSNGKNFNKMRQIFVMRSINQILENMLSSIDNYNLGLKEYTNLSNSIM